MAEVDGIVLNALRRLGCDINDEIVSIRQFTVEMLVEAVAACIRSVNPETPVPSRLSASMATKYRQASVIADACKAIGYTGDLGYEAFLYGGESDMRKLLVFLVDKIPKEEQSSSIAPYGNVFAREIRDVIAAEMERPWLPVKYWQFKTSRPHSTNAFPSVFRSQRLSVPLTHDDARQAKLLSEQVSPSVDLAVSIVEFNSLRLVCSGQQFAPGKGDSRSRQDQIDVFRRNLSSSLSGHIAPAVSEKPNLRTKPALPPRRNKDAVTSPQEPAVPSSPVVTQTELSEEDRIDALKKELTEASGSLEVASEELKVLRTAVNKAESAIREGKDFLDSFENTVKTRQQVSLASIDGRISTESLQNDVEVLQQSIEDLQNQWTTRKEALLTDLTQLRQQSSSQENSTERLKEEIREAKHMTSSLNAELSDRDSYVELLRKEHQKISKDVGRASYTKRILEILANIKKQRLDIDKIIKDTRIVQKDINHLSGRLDRAFTETDELMFRDAKGDEFVRKAYKNVATFHESCSALIHAVEATGVIMREMKDIEDEVDSETKKSKEQNFQRIQDDLKAIRAENASLTAKIS